MHTDTEIIDATTMTDAQRDIVTRLVRHRWAASSVYRDGDMIRIAAYDEGTVRKVAGIEADGTTRIRTLATGWVLASVHRYADIVGVLS